MTLNDRAAILVRTGVDIGAAFMDERLLALGGDRTDGRNGGGGDGRQGQDGLAHDRNSRVFALSRIRSSRAVIAL
ncbi:hypothetical protein P0F65_02410 [Sphingomonas sp. I4]